MRRIEKAKAYAPFSTRELAAAAIIDESVDYIAVLSPSGAVLDYKRDASGTALITSGGVNWSPANVAHPDHWADNIAPGTTDMRSAIQSAISWCATSGASLQFLPLPHLMSGWISATGSIRADATGAKFLVTSNSTAFTFKAALNGPYDLGSDYTVAICRLTLRAVLCPLRPQKAR